MSFFKKVLSKVGIGAAKIDAVLDQTELHPGQTISGYINITGGNAAQQINKIDLNVFSNYFAEEEYEEDDETHTRIIERQAIITAHKISQSFEIAAEENKQIPFELTLPEQAPLSIGKSNTWLETNLDIDFALDKHDKDYIKVVASPLQEATLDALLDLGFEMDEVENEACSSQMSRLPFIQEFEFKARTGDFAGKLDELELIMIARNNSLDLHLEIDRRARGFSGFFAEALGRDETNVRLNINDDNITEISDMLYDVIDQYS